MTLGELATVAKVEEVLISNVLKNLEVENSEEFCRYRIAKYLESIDFKNDSILALDQLVTTTVPLKDFSLHFFEIPLGNLQLRASYEIEESL
jgi:hypothetical protein